MNIQITARHSKASQSMQDFITEELHNLEKWTDKITSSHVILDSVHNDRLAEVVVTILGQRLSAKAKAEKTGKAVDLAMEKMRRQLVKFNDKLKDHKPPKISTEDVTKDADTDTDEDEADVDAA